MKQSKITFLTSVGAGLEYYDYVIYVLFASFISQNFFPNSSHAAALFATFAVFAIGNIIRPLGGIVFGILGDRFGRKKVFSNTLLWMSIATFTMGITPTFATIGLTATIIFSLCRIIQGITCGAEIPGATTFLLEHIQEKRRGLHFGFMSSAVGIGSSFGAFIAWILTKILTNEQMLEWGFRLPFLFGGILAMVGFFIRKYIPETPAFLAIKKTDKETIINFNQLMKVLNVIGILIFPASLVIFFLVLPVYLHDIYHYSFSDIYLAMTCGCLWAAFLIPIFGWASDYTGRKPMLFIAVLIYIVFSFPVFSLLKLETRLALLGFIGFGKAVIAAMAASYFVLLPQAFPTAIRYTGTAISYNIAYTIAALIPLIANYIYEALKRPSYMVMLLMFLAVITAISTIILKLPLPISDESKSRS